MSIATSPDNYPAAPALPDVLPPVKQRGRVGTFVHRHPTIVLGGVLVALMIGIAIFAPWLGTVDPDRAGTGQAAAPAVRRTTGSAPTCWAATSIRA